MTTVDILLPLAQPAVSVALARARLVAKREPRRAAEILVAAGIHRKQAGCVVLDAHIVANRTKEWL